MHVSSQNATKINILNEIVIEIPNRPTTTTGLSHADSYHLAASPYSIPYTIQNMEVLARVSIYFRFICEYDACPAIKWWESGISLNGTGKCRGGDGGNEAIVMITQPYDNLTPVCSVSRVRQCLRLCQCLL